MNLTPDQAKALDLQRNLAITAGAGSGKTTVLVNRYLHILLNNPELHPGNVLAITFTEKAAAEMKDRIFRELNSRFRENSGDRKRLFSLITQLHDTQIFTIHAFCSQVLRQYPVEAGISPDFAVLDEIQTAELLDQSFRDFFFNFDIEDHPEKTDVLAALREYSVPRLKQIFLESYRARAIIYPFLQKFASMEKAGLQETWEELYNIYHREILQPLLRDSGFRHGLSELTGLKTRGANAGRAKQDELRRLLGRWEDSAGGEFGKFQALSGILKTLTTSKGEAYKSIPGGKNYWGEEGMELFRDLSSTAARFTDALLEADAETEAYFAQVFRGMTVLLVEFLRELDGLKARQNLLDFEDLQLVVLHLLQERPEIRAQIRRRYPFILVDEFQDTDQLQYRIIYLLSHNEMGVADRNRLFVVGDPKQSIFGFRFADVSIFQDTLTEISRQLTEETPFSVPGYEADLHPTAENLRGIISLSQNFRSSPALIHFFNRTFSPVFRRETSFDVEFQALEASRSQGADIQSDIRLDLYFTGEDEDADLPGTEAQQIARRISALVENGTHRKFLRKDGRESGAPLEYGDMAVLLRSRTHLEILEQTFRESGIPYQTYKGSGFFQRQEILDVYHILRSLADPDDDFSLLTFLRSSYVALSDAALFYLSRVNGKNYREKLRRFHRWLRKEAESGDTFQQNFYDFIRENNLSISLHPGEYRAIEKMAAGLPEWSSLALHGRFSQLLDTLITDLRMRALLLAQPEGEQKLANLEKLLHFIFEFEQSQSTLLADLLDTLHKQISGELKEGGAVVMAEDQNKVKLITYHSAKGMEFPVVFLPFLERSFRFDNNFPVNPAYGAAFGLERSRSRTNAAPFIYSYVKQLDTQKITAEEKRLFYVAATRARDHLFLCGAAGKKGKIAENSVLNWLLQAYELTDIEMADGEETFPLENGGEFTISLHSTENMAETAAAPPDASRDFSPAAGIPPAHLKYQDFVPEKPGGQIYSATQLMLFRENKSRYFRHFYLNDGDVFPPRVDLEFVDEPGGALWGSTVHKLLEDFHLRSPAEDRNKIRQLLLQFGVSGEDDSVKLESQLTDTMKKIRRSELKTLLSGTAQYSEYPVNMKIGDFIFRGIFDRLFLNTENRWEVLDFKTNHVKPEAVKQAAEKYRFQMQAYALLLSAIHPGQEAYPVTLWFLVPMAPVRQVFHQLDIEVIRQEIGQLMKEILEQETDYFYR